MKNSILKSNPAFNQQSPNHRHSYLEKLKRKQLDSFSGKKLNITPVLAEDLPDHCQQIITPAETGGTTAESFAPTIKDQILSATINNLEKLEKNSLLAKNIIKKFQLKKLIIGALISLQVSTPFQASAFAPDQTKNPYPKPTTKISTNEYIPTGFPVQPKISNDIEQNYDGPSVRINNIPSGVNWVMPDNMSSSNSPDYNIYSEDCGWILLDSNSHNINPSLSFNNFSINFGTTDSNQSYIYRVGIKVYDKYNNLVAQIYGESPICNKDNYNSFNVGFSTNHFSTGYSQYGSDGEQYVDENTKNTLYLHNAKQLAFEDALRNLPTLKPLTPPANTNQYPYVQNQTPEYYEVQEKTIQKINFTNQAIDTNQAIPNNINLYSDWGVGGKLLIEYLDISQANKLGLTNVNYSINQVPLPIFDHIDKKYSGKISIKIVQSDGQSYRIPNFEQIITVKPVE